LYIPHLYSTWFEISILLKEVYFMQAKIKIVSLFFRLLFQIGLVAVPLVHIISWIYAPQVIGENIGFAMRVLPEEVKILYQLGASTKFFGFLIDMIPIVIIEFMLYFLIRLFRLYEQGEIFSLINVNYIKKIGYILFIFQLLSPITNGLLTGVLTWHNPPGHRYIAISLSGINIAMLLTASLIILISWIMSEGCRLREEQQLTI
jgi:hypothetical protein